MLFIISGYSMAVFVAINVGGKTNLNGRTTYKILRTGFQIITKGARGIFGFNTVKYTHTHTYTHSMDPSVCHKDSRMWSK
jgi:hypothetical protein